MKKKLQLRTETVRLLDAALRDASGGGPTTVRPSEAPSCYATDCGRCPVPTTIAGSFVVCL